MIVPQYGSSKITVFVWVKNTILEFLGNTKYRSMKLTLQLIVVCQVFFQQGRVALGKWRISLQKGHPKTPGMDFFFFTVPRPHFLGRALIWPGHLGEHVLSLLGLYPSSLSKSVGFVSLSGKASLVSISATIV